MRRSNARLHRSVSSRAPFVARRRLVEPSAIVSFSQPETISRCLDYRFTYAAWPLSRLSGVPYRFARRTARRLVVPLLDSQPCTSLPKSYCRKGASSRLPKKSLHPRFPAVFGSICVLGSTQQVCLSRFKATLHLSNDLPVITAERRNL